MNYLLVLEAPDRFAFEEVSESQTEEKETTTVHQQTVKIQQKGKKKVTSGYFSEDILLNKCQLHR